MCGKAEDSQLTNTEAENVCPPTEAFPYPFLHQREILLFHPRHLSQIKFLEGVKIVTIMESLHSACHIMLK